MGRAVPLAHVAAQRLVEHRSPYFLIAQVAVSARAAVPQRIAPRGVVLAVEGGKQLLDIDSHGAAFYPFTATVPTLASAFDVVCSPD